MTKFYAHLTEIHTLIVELEPLDLSEKEKNHLSQLIDSNLDAVIMDAILSELSEEDKMKFLRQLETGDHIQTWNFLQHKVADIEEKIKTVSKNLKEKLRQDIKEAHLRVNDKK